MQSLYQISNSFYFGSLLLVVGMTVILIGLFHIEKENLGRNRAFYTFIIILIYSILSFLFFPDILILIDSIVLLIVIILFLYPYKIDKSLTDDIPLSRYDERDIMFSRKELIPGTEKYLNYYKDNGPKELLDNEFRAQAGLLSEDSIYFHAGAFKAAKDFFSKIKTLVPQIDGETDLQQSKTDPNAITKSIRKKLKNLGALDTGITLCKDYHFYSHKGRGEQYGQRIEASHRYAIAFTVEMNQEMVAAAPKASIVMESAHQYHNAAKLAIETAKYIRSLGYSARAHIDGNYELICPLVARDAGLGEIGRMGILMTPKEGPRVRIGVITTDLELVPNEYKKNHALLDFCRLCKKCADCCPSASIPFDDPKKIDGVKRWKIDSESCFIFWSKAGTDCGRCMAVCPYSHPNNSLHKLIRFGIQNSKIFRILAVYLDDFFYGKKPKSKPLPEFLNEL